MQVAVICRISGFWSAQVVLLVSVSLSVPWTEILTSKPIRIPQRKWAGNEFLLISALVWSVAWKERKKNNYYFACTSAQTYQAHASCSSALRLLAAAFMLAAEVVSTARFWVFWETSTPSLSATWTGTEKKVILQSGGILKWSSTKYPREVGGGSELRSSFLVKF